MPEFELFVSAGVDEALELFVCHTKSVEIDGPDADEVPLDKLWVGVHRPTGGMGLLGELAEEHTAGRDERHALIELANGSDDVHLGQVLLSFWPQQKRVAICGE